LFVLAAGLGPLADRVSSKVLALALTAAAMCLATMILVSVSAKHAQVTGLAAVALAGCCLHVLLFAGSASLRSLAPLYAVLIGGWAFVGYIEPEPPLAGLLVLPAAPLALWVGRLLPFSHDTWRSTIVALVAVAVVLATGVAWTLLAS
jgi:hypothetical protein